jgi:hypothetical protein
MDIFQAEKSEYLTRLIDYYGENIVGGMEDLSPDFQARVEGVRHGLNSCLAPSADRGAVADWRPDKLLLLTTQRCTLTCRHCCYFSSPKSEVRLSEAAAEAIMTAKPSRVSLSGGESFTHPHFFDFIATMPVQAIFTNASWGYSAGICERNIRRLKSALSENPAIDLKSFTTYISVDKLHFVDFDRQAAAVANVIWHLIEELPKTNVRISSVQQEGDHSWEGVVSELTARGYRISSIDERREGTLKTTVYTVMTPSGRAFELPVDSFPAQAIGRALLNLDGFSKTAPALSCPSTSRSHYSFFQPAANARATSDYVVGPDGKVCLYDIFLVPPCPVFLGQFPSDDWQTALSRVSRDPIAISVKTHGPEEIAGLAERCFPGTTQSILRHCSSWNHVLHYVLMNPQRRLVLNGRLLVGLIKEGYLSPCEGAELPDMLRFFLEQEDKDERIAYVEHFVANIRRTLSKPPGERLCFTDVAS